MRASLVGAMGMYEFRSLKNSYKLVAMQRLHRTGARVGCWLYDQRDICILVTSKFIHINKLQPNPEY